ncbi:hypothetical protein [Laspinema sp. D2d]|uniref:hypothetical protein n=1 Tax=Laspinema sp. D2d TaxID=2953686 RepID=UPI0021BA6506|nr:hypothetical protein [Laspinema sp. D2d]
MHQENSRTVDPVIGPFEPIPSIFCIKIKLEQRSLVRHRSSQPPDPPGRSLQRFVSVMLF